MTTNDYIQLALAAASLILWAAATLTLTKPVDGRSLALHLAATVVTLLCWLWPTDAQALGAAGIAARGGVHRHCDDACLYRLDQAAEARRMAQAEEAWRRSPEGRRQAELAREAQRLREQEERLRPKPPKAHAERMGKVNILRSENDNR